jgi:hypothetical protein
MQWSHVLLLHLVAYSTSYVLPPDRGDDIKVCFFL